MSHWDWKAPHGKDGKGTQTPRELWGGGVGPTNIEQTTAFLSLKYLSGFCVLSIPYASIFSKPNIFILSSSDSSITLCYCWAYCFSGVIFRCGPDKIDLV